MGQISPEVSGINKELPQEKAAPADEPLKDKALGEGNQIEDELIIEEICIDAICGVY